MTEKELVKALKKHIRRQDREMRKNGKEGFKMRDPLTGNEMLPAKTLLRRIDTDKKFRKALITVITDLSIDLLSR